MNENKVEMNCIICEGELETVCPGYKPKDGATSGPCLFMGSFFIDDPTSRHCRSPRMLEAIRRYQRQKQGYDMQRTDDLK
jgi:hypothetical protein